MIHPKVITIIGANGSMGQLVAGIMASFGEAKVYMVCRSLEKAEKAKIKAVSSVKAGAIQGNLIPKDYTDLKVCLAHSDWIFESVAETYEAKEEINSLIERYAQDNAIISTGTSGLSIQKLSQSFSDKHRTRYIGTHFFNPPYNLTLCEVIGIVDTELEFLEEFECYLREVLRRSVVRVTDTPGFLGNRMGFQFINEVLQYAKVYEEQGGIDYMDAILGAFTGRSMAPLVTTDFVGLDIHKAIVDNLWENTQDYAHDTFKIPDFVNRLIKEGKLGRKSGEGLYKKVVTSEGNKEVWVYDVLTEQYRPQKRYSFIFAQKMIQAFRVGEYEKAFNVLVEDDSLEAQIALTFLLKYVMYAVFLSRRIARHVGDGDTVMTMGFNWAPPLGIIEAFGGKEKVKNLCLERLEPELLRKVDIEELFQEIPASEYDYRRYFKAKS